MGRVATAAQWIEGARPRTLPAAVAPVLAGTAVAAFNYFQRRVKGIVSSTETVAHVITASLAANAEAPAAKTEA